MPHSVAFIRVDLGVISIQRVKVCTEDFSCCNYRLFLYSSHSINLGISGLHFLVANLE